MRRTAALLLIPMLIAMVTAPAWGRRRATPVDTPATATQPVNETASDTSRINAQRRARAVSYVDDRGLTIYVDTVTNEEWTDSTLIGRVPKMEYPLIYSASVSVDLWDPVMRAFGQDYGLVGFAAELNMHNRYLPVFEIGLGQADHYGPDRSFHYLSPVGVYFRLGMNYNFLYNSNPDYMFTAGVRYGLSPFSFHVDDVEVSDPYWGTAGFINVPSQRVTAGWFEFCLGLRVKIFGPISAGWTFRYRAILHESKAEYGKPWYIPGYGSRGGHVGGSFSIYYTLPLAKRHIPEAIPEGLPAGTSSDTLPTETTNPDAGTEAVLGPSGLNP